MNRAELVKAVRENMSCTSEEAEQAVRLTLGTVTDTLKSGEEVAIVGFGTLSVRQRAARTARNPRTGEPVNVAASKTIKFKASKTFKEEV